MKKFLWLILLMPLASSCASLKLSELSPTGRNQYLLPPLEGSLDVVSFEAGFGATISQSYGGAYSVTNNYAAVATSSRTYANPTIQHFITLFERDMRNIAEEYGEKKGFVVCRLITGGNKDGGWGFAIFTGLTLFIANLCGMPICTEKAYMQIEVSVYDNENKLLGRYTSNYHNEKEKVAFYYGYSMENAKLKGNLTVFKECMTDIKQQIDKDYYRLATLLE